MFNYIKNTIINHLNSDVTPKGLVIIYLIALNFALFISPYFPGSRWPMITMVHLVTLLGVYSIYVSYRQNHPK